MKMAITIEYSTGDVETYTAQPPEWARWELKTGNTITNAHEKMGANDLLFLAYYAMKREMAGKPVKPFEIWCEGVADINIGNQNPKVLSVEA